MIGVISVLYVRCGEGFKICGVLGIGWRREEGGLRREGKEGRKRRFREKD